MDKNYINSQHFKARSASLLDLNNSEVTSLQNDAENIQSSTGSLYIPSCIFKLAEYALILSICVVIKQNVSEVGSDMLLVSDSVLATSDSF